MCLYKLYGLSNGCVRRDQVTRSTEIVTASFGRRLLKEIGRLK